MKIRFLTALAALLFCTSAFSDIVFQAERRAALSSDLPLHRYELNSSRNGTQIWEIAFELPSGSYLLQTSGHTLIKHVGIPISGYGGNGTDYAIYANCRVALFTAATLGALPEVGTAPSAGDVVAVIGLNILNQAAHYGLIPTNTQKVITGGAYRVELWCAAGSDADDNADGLGAMGAYNAGNTHQFNVKVETLPN